MCCRFGQTSEQEDKSSATRMGLYYSAQAPHSHTRAANGRAHVRTPSEHVTVLILSDFHEQLTPIWRVSTWQTEPSLSCTETIGTAAKNDTDRFCTTREALLCHHSQYWHQTQNNGAG